MRHRSPDPVPADPFEAHRSRGHRGGLGAGQCWHRDRGPLDAQQAPAITVSLEAATVAVART